DRADSRRAAGGTRPSAGWRCRWRKGNGRAGIQFGWHAGAASKLPEKLDFSLIGIRHELQQGSEPKPAIHKRICESNGVRLFRGERKVAGQDDVRAGRI